MRSAKIEPVRLAIIGSGNIASMHARAIERLTGARLVAVCSRNAEKAAQIAAPAGAQIFGALEDLLAAKVAEALLIATPSGVHAESVLPALRAGLHILCEKPLEIRSERIRDMITEAKQQKVILGGFFPLRQGAGAQAIRQALNAGRFGRLTFLSARIKWWRETEYYADSSWRGTWAVDGGGALMNQGIHAVDLLQWFGGAVTEVSAYASTLAHPDIEVEDTLAASVRFGSGALGTIAAATSCYPGLDISLEISGEAGTAVLVNDRINFWRFRKEFREDDAIRQNKFDGTTVGGTSDPLAISSEGHRQQIEAFARALRDDQTAEVIDGREAGQAVAIVEAVYRSVQSGKSESVIAL